MIFKLFSIEFGYQLRNVAGKDYNKDCLTKKPKLIKGRVSPKEELYLFKIRCLAPLADWEEDGIFLELYKDFKRKHNLNFIKYIKDAEG